jgi:hypothetical protein
MADNVELNAGSGGATIAADEVTPGIFHQRVKVQHGADGSATDVSTASPLPVSVAKTALTPGAPAAASVGVTTAEAVAANANRKGMILTNTSQATISLGFAADAVLLSGVTLFPGGIFKMDEYSLTVGAINAIASAAASNLAIQEFS